MILTAQDMTRFAQRHEAVPEAGCWLWTAGLFNGRYGQFNVAGSPKLAHRISWMIHRGAIPEGVCVLHRCDTPQCVNPDHLFLGSVRDNNADRAAKNRSHRPRGSLKSTAKLTNERVAELRALPILTFAEATRLAGEWGVSPFHLYRVRSGTRWLAA